ncbi:MAG: Gfo/Idh/MocA family protein [Planctomycetaceae bacterium]
MARLSMVPQTYRAAILGLGFIGAADQVSGDLLGQQVVNLDGTHLQSYVGNPRVELIAGSSRDEGRRERFAARTGARVYADWRELLQGEKPEIVSVASYAPAHADMTIEAARAGARVVWCEKPIATRLGDADRMVEACRETGTLLVVNHNRRFHPQFRALQRVIADGRLGLLRGGSLAWPTGRLGNVGTHFFNVLLMLADRPAEAVSASLDLAGRPDCRGTDFRDPGGWGSIRLREGVTITFEAPDYSRAPPRLSLHGDLGRVTVEGSEATVDLWGQSPQRVPPAQTNESSMDRALSEIIGWLDGNRSFVESPESSRQTLEIIVACHLSHDRQGAWVQLPLAAEELQREIKTG